MEATSQTAQKSLLATLPPGKRARLHRLLYEFGPGNGTLMFLPIDQGIEHGPRDFFPNPASKDPDYQFRLAAENGFTGQLQEQGAQLLKRLPVFFQDHDPAPSLLHGDLWGGNWGSCDGEPVIFDPAVYYGDRESDLAMTRLFGGFGRAFYEAYEASAPLASGHRERCDLYQLYHILNHLNLFGSAYVGRAQDLIRNLL